MNENIERQIDAAVEALKILLLPRAKNQQEAEELKRSLDAIGHEVKAVSAIVNDGDIYKAVLHKILSQVRRD